MRALSDQVTRLLELRTQIEVLKISEENLYFQPAYFCVKGNFYQTTLDQWLLRTFILALFLSVFNTIFFRVAKKRHQAFGG